MKSEKHKFVYIHTRKTAGSSMKKALKGKYEDEHFLNDGVLSKDWSVFKEQASDYFIFTTIRNPWDKE